MDTDTVFDCDGNAVELLRPNFDGIPIELQERCRWAVWKATPREGNPGKFNKAPVSPTTRRMIGTNKPELWGSFAEAKAAYEAGGYTGVGLLLDGSGLIGIDIDDASAAMRTVPDLTQWIKDASKAGAYLELSPSNKGLRLFLEGQLVEAVKGGPLEVYTDRRFMTVTGRQPGAKRDA